MFVPCKCPQCGGDLQIPDDKDIVKCMYCSTDIKVREVINIQVGNAKNIEIVAEAAFQAGNYAAAYASYSKLIEIDPLNSFYWMYRGISIGWLSNLISDNFGEMLAYVNTGIENAENDSLRDVIRLMAAPEIYKVANGLFELGTNHVMEFISVPSAIDDQIARCKRIIGALERAGELDPAMTEINDLIVDIATRQYGISRATDSDKSFFKKIAAQYTTSATPERYKKRLEGSSCFVVTATMGNELNPFVVALRKFRTEILLESDLGIAFVSWYYRNGPFFARIIKSSNFLRILSFVVIVMPSFVLVKLFDVFVRLRRLL